MALDVIVIDEEETFEIDIPKAQEVFEIDVPEAPKIFEVNIPKRVDPFIEEQKQIASAIDANRTKDFFLGKPRAFTEAEPPRLEAQKIQKQRAIDLTETKIGIVKKQLEQDLGEEELYGLAGTLRLYDFMGATSAISKERKEHVVLPQLQAGSYLSPNGNEEAKRLGLSTRQRILATPQGFFLAREAAKRTIAEKPFSIKKMALTLPFEIAAISLEFQALPDVTSKIKWLEKASLATRRIVSTGILFGEHAALQAPGYKETLGDRLTSIGASTTMGALLGTIGLGSDTTVGMLEERFGLARSAIRRFAVRAPITSAALGTITALRGGSSSDVLETVSAVLAFQTLGLVKYSVVSKIQQRAIKQARKLQPELNNLSDNDVKALLTAQATAVEQLLNVSLKDPKITKRLDFTAKQNVKLLEIRVKQQFLERQKLAPTKTKTIKILDENGVPVEKKVTTVEPVAPIAPKPKTLAQNVKTKQETTFNRYTYAQSKGLSLDSKQIDSVHKIAGSDIVYSNVINHVKSYYPTMPTDKQSQQYIFDLSKDMALQQKRLVTKIGKATKRGHPEPRTVTQFSRVVNAVGDVEAQTGVRLLQPIEGAVRSSNRQTYNVAKTAQEILRKRGLSKVKVAALEADPIQNQLRADFLFESDATKRNLIFRKMTPDSKKLTAAMNEMLQGPAATQVRKGRFMLWDRADAEVNKKISNIMVSKKPDKVKRRALNTQVKKLKVLQKEYVPDGKQSDLAAYRFAKAEGREDAWLGTQTTATRKHYFMSAKDAEQMNEFIKMGVPEELAAVVKQPDNMAKQDLAAFHTRGKRAKVAKRGSAFAAVLEHWERVAIQNATAEDLGTFVRNVDKTPYTNQDLISYRRVINNILHRYPNVEQPVKFLRGANALFWKVRYMNPQNVNKFGLRQGGQNPAYAPSQVSIIELVKSQVKFAKQVSQGKIDPGLKQAYHEIWADTINQSRAMWNEVMLQMNNTTANKYMNTSQARAMSNLATSIGAQTVPFTDTANRMALFVPTYISFRDNARLFNAGKISKNQLINRLRLRQLHSTKQLILDSKINNPHEYAKEGTKIVVANVHGTYDTKIRPIYTQTAIGKMLAGLETFPRIGAEIMHRNGIRPMIDGFRTRNYKKVWAGTNTILRFAATSSVTHYAMLESLGFNAYHPAGTILQFSPGDPGFSAIFETAGEMSSIAHFGIERGDSTAKIVKDESIAAADRLSIFIPLADAIGNVYSANNDVQGAKLWKIIEKQLQDDYVVKNGVRFKKETRTEWEKFSLIAWGGFKKSRQEKTQTFGK